MFTSASLLTLALFISTVVALPSRATPAGVGLAIEKRAISTNVTDGVVDFEKLKAHVNRLNIKYAQNFARYQSNTGSAHPLAASHSTRATSGGDPLTDLSDELWFGTISVGTPPVQYTVDFDTGSSDLFLPSSSCSNCGQHTTYNPKKSSTSKDLKKTFELQYGDGSTTSGEQFSDTISIAGLTATGQALGSATDYSSSFAASGTPDGLMGLAFPSLSAFPATPYFNTLISQKKVASGQFAFYLAESGSELFLGGTNPARFTGSFNWNTVTQQSYWQIALNSVKVGSKSVASNLQTIVDSGTTLIVGDTQTVKKIYSAIPGSQDLSQSVGEGFHGFPCNAAPTVSFTFGSTSYSVSPQFFNLGAVSQGSSTCVGAIMAQDLGFWILGDVFMRNVYTAFDFTNSRVGFATLAH